MTLCILTATPSVTGPSRSSRTWTATRRFRQAKPASRCSSAASCRPSPSATANPMATAKSKFTTRKRFFVVTGHRLADCPTTVEDRQAQLDALYRLVFGEEDQMIVTPPPKPTGSNSLANLDDTTLLDKAMNAANGDRFSRLWNGDTSDHDYDHSRADLALCCSLAFWTGGDAHRMDCLFRASGLMREKWDERRGDKSYGQLTINKALARVADHYTPGHIGSSPTTTDQGDEGKTDANADSKPKVADRPPPGASAKGGAGGLSVQARYFGGIRRRRLPGDVACQTLVGRPQAHHPRRTL